MHRPNRGAEASRDEYYRLTYRDPTGETAVRNLMGRTVQITWENGFTLYVSTDDIQPYLDQLEFRMSRKAHVWGHKKKTPAPTGVQS